MRLQLRRMFAAMLLTVCIGAPVVEMVDRWDHTLQDGNDTESNLVVVVLCVGVAFVAAATIVRRMGQPLTRSCLQAACRPFTARRHIPLLPTPHASPPTVLRV